MRVLSFDRRIIEIFANALVTVVGPRHPVSVSVSQALRTGEDSHLSAAEGRFNSLPGLTRRRVHDNSVTLARMERLKAAARHRRQREEESETRRRLAPWGAGGAQRKSSELVW